MRCYAVAHCSAEQCTTIQLSAKQCHVGAEQCSEAVRARVCVCARTFNYGCSSVCGGVAVWQCGNVYGNVCVVVCMFEAMYLAKCVCVCVCVCVAAKVCVFGPFL